MSVMIMTDMMMAKDEAKTTAILVTMTKRSIACGIPLSFTVQWHQWLEPPKKRQRRYYYRCLP